MSENTNRQFGKYHLISHLATGGMADIYLASQKSIGGFEKLLVIKRILPNLAKDKKFIEMFLDEARIAAQLNHPNVIQIFDLGQVQGRFFIAMEYLSGESLSFVVKSCLKNNITIPSHLVAGMIMQAAEGLHHAHTMTSPDGTHLRIVHRDISPQNIFVQYDGGVKVVDFGIATATSRSTKTKTGTLKGKYAYMSPEQVLGLELDGRSDVFSLGIVFWECLVGRKLFNKRNDLELLNSVVGTDAPSPKDVNPSVPQELADIALKALARRREERYQSAAEFRHDLASYLRTISKDSDTMAVSRFMQGSFAERIKKKRAIIENAKRLETELGDTLFGDLESYVSDTEISVPNSAPDISDRAPSLVSQKGHKTLWFVFFFLLVLIGASTGYLLSDNNDSQNTNSVISDAGIEAESDNGHNPPQAGTRLNIAKLDDSRADGGQELPDAGILMASSKADSQNAEADHKKNGHSAKHRLAFLKKKKKKRKKPNRVLHISKTSKKDAIKHKPKEHSAQSGLSGKLRLMTTPWSNVFYKGKDLGQTPLVDVEFPAGPVKLRLVNKGAGIDRVIVVNIKPGKKNVFRKSLY